MLYALFDRLMRRLGRKYALVDAFGKVAFYRYYIFFVEKHIAESWKERYLPNLFVHHFVGEESQQWVDAEVAHTHPWNTLSIVLRGGYTEEEEYDTARLLTTTAPGIIVRSWKTSHRFTRMTPNTWTMIFHGIRQGKWAFDHRVHEVICPTCEQFNGGVCMNTSSAGLQEFGADIDLKQSSSQSKKWRGPTWIKCDEGFEQLVSERIDAMARSGVPVPATFNERYLVIKEKLAKKNR